MKRLLVPIIGKGLSYLFGIATESDLNTIHSSIGRLAKSQEDITHVVDENISVINITRVEMSENRQALSKMIGSLANLNVKLGNITQAIGKGGFQVGQFVQLYLQLESIIQTKRTVCMWSMYTYNYTCSQWDTLYHQSLLQEV